MKLLPVLPLLVTVAVLVAISLPPRPTQAALSPAIRDDVHPEGTRVGIRPVDRILQAVERENLNLLVASVRYTPVPCDNNPIFVLPSPPPCPRGEPEGTLVDAFLVGYCETEWVTRRHVRGQLSEFLRSSVLYSVYRKPGTPSGVPFYYGLLYAEFNLPPVDSRTLMLDRKGAIVGVIIYHCGHPPPSVLRWADAELVLPPRGSRDGSTYHPPTVAADRRIAWLAVEQPQ